VKFFLDENMAVVSLAPLQVIYRHRHLFENAETLHLKGVDDVELYPRVKAAGVDAIISKDERQLSVQEERRGLWENRLTFIHLHMNKVGGVKGLALELATVTAGLPYVEERWAPEPHVFRLRGLQSGFTERVSSHRPIWLESWGLPPDV
jgi:PIN like domain